MKLTPAHPGMGAVSARGLLKAHDDDVRDWNRLSKPTLAGILKAAHNYVPGYGPDKWSKDELINALAEDRYPAADLNLARHVLYHVDGLTNSACEHCPQPAPAGDPLAIKPLGCTCARYAGLHLPGCWWYR